MDLPEVAVDPRHYPDCCLSISTRLLDTLTDAFSTAIVGAGAGGTGTGLVLSIGSGSGLLEALLLSRWSSSPSPSAAPDPNTLNRNRTLLQIEGVEIRSSPPVNRYLPDPENLTIVKGSWDVISPRARRAATATARSTPTSAVRGLMFVYPRSPGLVGKYVRDFAAASAAAVAETVEAEAGVETEETKGTTTSTIRPVSLKSVVWLGHRSDWPDFEPCFAAVPGLDAATVEVVGGADAGLVEYEMMAVMAVRGAVP
ncbi:hypothetical protein SLS62_001327 [Diatrype stigma]|uniref:Uncharacterized protein n=1 Tax=Diatrype stigma TaxID=117547 RepID=A0AAN9UY36_9PEZI